MILNLIRAQVMTTPHKEESLLKLQDLGLSLALNVHFISHGASREKELIWRRQQQPQA
jgi:hypothetical protein